MNIRIQQLNPTIGDIDNNSNAILKAMGKADRDGVDLLILPELTVCGYPPMDLLERQSFRQRIYQANSRITELSGSTAVLFGSVTPNPSAFGRKCYNSALLVQGGEVIEMIHKTLLPTYDVFDDYRYFEPNKEFSCIEFEGRNLGVTICEDIWYNENDIQYHTYDINPAQKLAEQGAEIIINISASPYTKTKPANRQQMLQNHARALGLPVLYSNQVGANTEVIFDGDSMAINDKAEVIARTSLFKEASMDLKWNDSTIQAVNHQPEPVHEKPEIEQMFNALCLGLRDYLTKSELTDNVVIGLSGGIDSALVACIAKEALGSDNVTGITMPSEFSSEGSVTDSEKLAQNLGITLHELPIKTIYDSFYDILEPLFASTSFGVAEENLQTRARGVLLMAYSNKFGAMLLNTGNKSELATGYCTLYGDMAGSLGIISDLYKSEVYEMANWLNGEFYGEEVIPSDILTKPPSAELRPGQKDTDTLPEYGILDAILEHYIEDQYSIGQIVDEGYEIDLVRKVINMVDRNEYKRYQAVPGLKVSTKAFGTGRRWPVVQRWTNNRLA